MNVATAILSSPVFHSLLITAVLLLGGWSWKGSGWKSAVDIKLRDLETARIGFNPLQTSFNEVKQKTLEIEPIKSDVAVIRNDIGHIKDSINALDAKFDDVITEIRNLKK